MDNITLKNNQISTLSLDIVRINPGYPRGKTLLLLSVRVWVLFERLVQTLLCILPILHPWPAAGTWSWSQSRGWIGDNHTDSLTERQRGSGVPPQLLLRLTLQDVRPLCLVLVLVSCLLGLVACLLGG